MVTNKRTQAILGIVTSCLLIFSATIALLNRNSRAVPEWFWLGLLTVAVVLLALNARRLGELSQRPSSSR